MMKTTFVIRVCLVLAGCFMTQMAQAQSELPTVDYSVRNGTLYVKGSAQADTIDVSSNPAGNGVLIRRADNRIINGPLDASQFDRIVIYGYGGNDTIRTDGLAGLANEFLEPLEIYIYGGDDHDTIDTGPLGFSTSLLWVVGGSGSDTMFQYSFRFWNGTRIYLTPPMMDFNRFEDRYEQIRL